MALFCAASMVLLGCAASVCVEAFRLTLARTHTYKHKCACERIQNANTNARLHTHTHTRTRFVSGSRKSNADHHRHSHEQIGGGQCTHCVCMRTARSSLNEWLSGFCYSLLTHCLCTLQCVLAAAREHEQCRISERTNRRTAAMKERRNERASERTHTHSQTLRFAVRLFLCLCARSRYSSRQRANFAPAACANRFA